MPENLILRECRKAATPYYIPPGARDNCQQWVYDCRHEMTIQVLLALESAAFFIYFLLFFYYLLRAFRQLRARNYRYVLAK